ncbi:acyltransferase family protein [Aquihabitans daechungensis]|uniref:acyltransferase family protein n=1 Tax=Aquihabitans daechungensis TaxID=1052257 RepID=UPI003BA1F841
MAATSTAAAEAPVEPGSLSGRNPQLEGLRAVAALAVLVTHVSLNAMGNDGPFGGLLARLDVGVAVFFVLSGYLLYKPFVRALLRDGPDRASGGTSATGSCGSCPCTGSWSWPRSCSPPPWGW